MLCKETQPHRASEVCQEGEEDAIMEHGLYATIHELPRLQSSERKATIFPHLKHMQETRRGENIWLLCCSYARQKLPCGVLEQDTLLVLSTLKSKIIHLKQSLRTV